MGLLSEKADSPNLLRMSGGDLEKARTSMTQNRDTVDRGYTDAAKLISDASDTAILSAFDTLKTSMTSFLAARKAIDSALASVKPGESTAGIEIGRAGNALMAATLELASELEAEMAASQPVLGQLGAIKNVAWQVRNVGGSVWEVAHIPYTGGPALTPDLIKRLDIIEGRTQSYWELLQSMAAQPQIPIEVRQAVEHAGTDYFEGDFGALRKSIVADVQAGKFPQMPFSTWLPKLIEAINTITNSAIVSMDAANALAVEAQAKAIRTEIISGAVSLAVIGLWIFGYVGMKRRLFDPLAAMTQVVRRLADNDTAVTVPSVGKRDELGQMASAVLVFKENAIMRMQLEEEARHFQAELDRKLKATEAAFEAAGERQRAFLGMLAGGLAQLADGDLSTRIAQNVDNEFESIRGNFNHAVAGLEGAISAVLETAGTLTGGVEEISQSTDNLSRRTEQQAAALEETAAALQEITGNVDSAARLSGEARNVASTAVANATKSATVVADASRPCGASRRLPQRSAISLV